jgi:hypothetical protein
MRDGERPGGTLDPAAATATVEILANETRLRAILALSRRQAERPTDPAVRFAELRRLADVEDSGNFAYHLDRLRDRFVTRTDAGYILTDAGTQVASILHAGTLALGETVVHETDHECVVCGGDIEARATTGGVEFTCDSGHGFREIGLPTAALEQGVDHAVREATRRMLSDLETTATGVCARCHQPVEWGLRAVDEAAGAYHATARCTGCAMVYGSPLVAWAVADWDVRARLRMAGFDILDLPPWELLDLPVSNPTLVDGDPSAAPAEAAFRLVFEVGERPFTVEIDGTSRVRSVEDE